MTTDPETASPEDPGSEAQCQRRGGPLLSCVLCLRPQESRLLTDTQTSYLQCVYVSHL